MPRRSDLSVNELISDPIVQLTMLADGVAEQELRSLLASAGWKVDESGVPPEREAAAAPDDDYRRGVGIMLLNEQNDVFVGCRVDAAEAWQMPQGGIEPGEEPHHAAYRELREEIGTDNAEIVAESVGWHRYDLPSHIRPTARHRGWRGQEQKWFVMRFRGSDQDIRVETEHPEFNAWKWVNPSRLPELAVEFKRQIYIDLLSEFGEPHLRRTE